MYKASIYKSGFNSYKMKCSTIVRISILLLSFSLQVNAQQKYSYHILKTHHIGGANSWDYITVDPEQHRIYVSNGTRVAILDELSGDSVGVIPNTNGVHGIAFVSALGKGYTSNGRSNSSTVFDLKTNKIITEVKTGENPDAIFYDDYSKKVFVFNGRSKNATVIDPATDKVIATIDLGGKPETGVSDGKGMVLVNIEDTSEIAEINATSFKVEKRWKLDEGEEPTGLAIDRNTKRLFVGCSNKLMLVLDAVSGKTLAKLPIGNGCDGVAFDPTLKLAFASNGQDGTLSVIQEVNAGKFEVVQTVKTEVRARTLTVDPKNHHVFLPSANSNGAQAVAGSFHVLEVGEK
jgi:YVTN family beta-propeller protein